MKTLRFVAFALALAMPAAAIAQDADSSGGCADQDNQGGQKKKHHLKTVKRADGVIVVQETFVVCGKVPAPAALVVINSSMVNYEWENAKPNFLKRVGESLKKAPF